VSELTREQLEALNSEFESASPHDILRWAAETFGDELTVVTSFQPTGIVTLHILHEIAPRTPVLTLDTGLLFPETYTLIDEVEALFNLNLIRVRPKQTVDQQAEIYGAELWKHDPDYCCQLRKTEPLTDSIAPYRAWITGLRRDQADTRKATPLVSWDTKYQKVKLSPFANWTEDMIWTYIHAHELPYNVLHYRGYPSIGCLTCTQPVSAGDLRSGRWVNQGKTECGIHVVPAVVKPVGL
jgi:phosphoadenosine phosphosulfate reductase